MRILRTSKLLPCQTYLQERLDYDPETGVILWRKMQAHHAGEMQVTRFNKQYAGKPAAALLRSKKRTNTYIHRNLNILGFMFPAAFVVYLLVTGKRPNTLVLIDGDIGNLRIENLRLPDEHEALFEYLPERPPLRAGPQKDKEPFLRKKIQCPVAVNKAFLRLLIREHRDMAVKTLATGGASVSSPGGY